METLIVICLLVVIGLMLEDKIRIRKSKGEITLDQKPELKTSEIIGLPKPFERLSGSRTANESQLHYQLNREDNFEQENESKSFDKQIPQEELDEVFGKGPDLSEEEEEWSRHGFSDDQDGFATGVTFEELSAVGMLIQQEKLEESLEQKAAAIVQKIQGTELLSLLGNSMQDASKKIEELLNLEFSNKMESSSSTLRNHSGDFNIQDFV